ncbi:hypothetical protein [Bifidobacterium sp. ESL0790]|uniref:hypothetical protein n=1 Tax=Bifidobacterium sp. ESL0790 TaxID=2983233 RepID=UPI0023FA4333|nr:hypothetical protein [Bifidobacterium sp. ESL0790]WEV72463.1 hypothetical protein OZY47_00235 [Bifidobacterium sp. ESL0790]
MKPQLGDIISNRYTLVSLLRSVPGLEAWKANDRILARDCQVFIVTDKTAFASFEAISSSLALSRNSHFTKVIQMRHTGDVPTLITRLDEGLSLNAYLGGDNKRTLGYEAMRSIIGETAGALQFLLDDDLEFGALSTDIVRVTASGVQIADAPIVGLLKDTVKTPDMTPEEVAVYQLAALLYAMVTGQRTSDINGFDLSALEEKTPEEFHIICERGLTVSYLNGKPTIPMVSLAELVALLGDWKPVAELGKSEIDRPNMDGPASIVKVPLRRSERNAIVDFPAGLFQSQAQFRANKGARGRGAAAAAGVAGAAGAAGAGAGTAANGKTGAAKRGGNAGASQNASANRNNKNASNQRNGRKSQNAQGKQAGQDGNAVPLPATGANGKASKQTTDADNPSNTNESAKTNGANIPLPSRDEANTNAASDKSRKWWAPRNHNHDPEQRRTGDENMDLHDLTAAEMADVFKSFDSTADDSIFPDFARSEDIGSTTNPTMQFDFSTHAGNGNGFNGDDGDDGQGGNSHEFEATGRIPMMDENGMEILPGDESARALRAEQEAIDAANPVITPPSFTPQTSQKPQKESKDIADTPLFGKLTTKVVAIIAVVVLVIAALGVAVYALSDKPGKDHTSSVKNNPWPDMNVDKVPFGDDSDSGNSGDNSSQNNSQGGNSQDSNQQANKHKTHVSSRDKKAASVPKPNVPANDTPFDIDKQEFLTNPAGQQGFGYYMHLSEPQDVYRFVVRIRSSGGNAFLIAGSSRDPSQGQQVAQFSFDASGTTDVKLKKKVNAQDFILWVPASSLPNNQLYIEKVQFF